MQKCNEMAYGEGPFPSVVFKLKLAEDAAKLLGKKIYCATYHQLSIQTESVAKLHAFCAEKNFSTPLTDMLHVGSRQKAPQTVHLYPVKPTEVLCTHKDINYYAVDPELTWNISCWNQDRF